MNRKSALHWTGGGEELARKYVRATTAEQINTELQTTKAKCAFKAQTRLRMLYADGMLANDGAMGGAKGRLQ